MVVTKENTTQDNEQHVFSAGDELNVSHQMHSNKLVNHSYSELYRKHFWEAMLLLGRSTSINQQKVNHQKMSHTSVDDQRFSQQRLSQQRVKWEHPTLRPSQSLNPSNSALVCVVKFSVADFIWRQVTHSSFVHVESAACRENIKGFQVTVSTSCAYTASPAGIDWMQRLNRLSWRMRLRRFDGSRAWKLWESGLRMWSETVTRDSTVSIIRKLMVSS